MRGGRVGTLWCHAHDSFPNSVKGGGCLGWPGGPQGQLQNPLVKGIRRALLQQVQSRSISFAHHLGYASIWICSRVMTKMRPSSDSMGSDAKPSSLRPHIATAWLLAVS
jgi:hypothetical protein